MMKRFLLIFSLMISVASVGAQSVDWLVAPQYSEILYFGPQMYKVTKNGKVGLISTDGTVIVQPQYDAINLFYEGRAIFANKTQDGWQLKGVVTDNGVVKYASGIYYLLNDYKFFSEGFITVTNASGKYGYLDENCEPAFEFSSDEVRPFSEGFAAVGNEDTFHWINTSGEQILPRLSNGGTPYGGTNFYNGKAYLWDEDGEIFVLGDDGSDTKMPDTDSFVVDFLYRMGTEFGEKVNYTSYEQTFSQEWHPDCKNGKWTFAASNGRTLSAYQYDEVRKFSDGTAVAAIDGHYGLLHIVPDNASFLSRNVKSNLQYSDGDSSNCEFQLLVPEHYRNQDITIQVTDAETGKPIHINSKGNDRYAFSYQPSTSPKKEKKDFKIEVKNNGKVLWQGKESYSFEKRAKLKSFIRVHNNGANSNDRCLVTATIKNPSSVDVTTTVTLSGGGAKAHFANKSVKMTIPAYSTRSITSYFVVKNVELNGWCAVNITNGASAKRSGLQLKPF